MLLDGKNATIGGGGGPETAALVASDGAAGITGSMTNVTAGLVLR
jgi:hypothetical protein